MCGMYRVLGRLPLIFALACVAIGAWSVCSYAYQMYRYTDSAGKKLYVQSMEDVPQEFRPSASAVRIMDKSATKEEDASESKPVAETGDAVKVVGQFQLSPSADNGRTRLKGEVKNYLPSKVTNVQLHVQVSIGDGAQIPESVFPVMGKGGAGILEPGESTQVDVKLGSAASAARGFGFNLSWQTTTVVPEQKKAPAATQEAPAKQP